MSIKDSMKTRVISVLDTDEIGTAANQFVEHHIGTLPVTNADGKLVGVLQLRDLLKLVLPEFTKLLEDFDFVGSFGAARDIQPSAEDISRTVSEVMVEAVAVDVNCGLTRAFALLHKHNLTDLLVVDAESRLVGIASRVDVGTAMMKDWEIVSGVKK